MAGSVKDPVVRRVVRQILLSKEGPRLSDREVARRAECHKLIVREVRTALISQGKHPPFSRYRAGAAARGGYVFNRNGTIIPEADWLIDEATKVDKRMGERLEQLLDNIKQRPPKPKKKP